MGVSGWGEGRMGPVDEWGASVFLPESILKSAIPDRTIQPTHFGPARVRVALSILTTRERILCFDRFMSPPTGKFGIFGSLSEIFRDLFHSDTCVAANSDVWWLREGAYDIKHLAVWHIPDDSVRAPY